MGDTVIPITNTTGEVTMNKGASSNGTTVIHNTRIRGKNEPVEAMGAERKTDGDENRPPGHDVDDFYRHAKNLAPTICFGVALIHAMCIPAFFPAFFSWSGLAICISLYIVTGGLGITLCYHRLLTHKSFRTPNWLRALLTICGTASLQGGPIRWVSQHRIHHKHSDQPGDPHSPAHGGLWWAHTFWFLFKLRPGEEADEAAKDLSRDPVISFIDSLFWIPQIAITLLLFGLGYWYGGITLACSWVVWGVGVRTVAVYHVTWLVNSAAHTTGYQTHDTGDNSRNTWWVALVSFGEGWHNNHHHKQRSAAHGMKWFEFDPTFWMIMALGYLGLAKDIVMPDGRVIFKKDPIQEEIQM